MRSTTPHFTALKRFVAPTPMIEVEMTCVVETGTPSVAVHVEDERGGRFGGEAVDGLHLHHLVAHGANDAPAAAGRAQRHGEART